MGGRTKEKNRERERRECGILEGEEREERNRENGKERHIREEREDTGTGEREDRI